MDIQQDPYFILNRKVMSIIGLWPDQTQRERFLRYCVVGFMLWYSVLAQLCQLFTLDFELGSIIAFLQTFMPLFCTLHLYFSFVPHIDKIREILTNIIRDWKLLRDDIEIKIMKRCINDCRRFAIASGFTLYLYISFVLLPSLLRIFFSTNEVMSSKDHFPIFSCFDYFLERETYYYPIMTYQIFTILISPMVAIICYTMYLFLVLHLRAQLSIINYLDKSYFDSFSRRKINQQFQNSESKVRVLEEQMDLTHWIVDIIKHLTTIMQYTITMNALFEKPYFFQVSLGFLILVVDFLCLFQISDILQNERDTTVVFTYLSFVVGTVGLIYMNFYIGQRFMDDSIDVYKEACLIPIHEISTKTQKLLLTMLTMFSTPCAISIGKVFVSSHEFYSNLIRSSLSLAMILHSTQKVSV